VVEVESLSFGILKNVSLKVGKGKVIGIVGKNGAGKTTLLKCLGGFFRYRGSVRIEGREVLKVSPEERFRLVNYLPQNFNYYFPLTVFEFLRATTGKGENEIKEKLEYLKIFHLKDRFVNSLSGGERVKVQIARLLISDPKVFLFDEPTAFLDVTVYSEIEKLVLELKGKNRTVFITAHDLSFLYDVCDLFLGIEEGKTVFLGGKEEFLRGIEEIFRGRVLVKEINGEVFIKPKKEVKR
jgi:iron complex transport system ATP-binding protein